MNFTPRLVGFSASLHRDAILGARIGTVAITDANTNDLHTLSIVSGNSAGIFELDAATGVLRVADESALLNATQTSHVLAISASDNGSPPRTATANVTLTLVASNAITAKAPQQELFYNIASGTAVSDLTTKAKYPKRPDALRPTTGFQGAEDIAENYGSRIRAYVTPANGGSFYFYLSSDDSSALYYNASTNSGTPVDIVLRGRLHGSGSSGTGTPRNARSRLVWPPIARSTWRPCTRRAAAGTTLPSPGAAPEWPAQIFRRARC